MALPAPAATLCQLARHGWPLAVALLLTLLLGWSALHEGRDGPATYGWQAHAEDLQQAMPMPAPPADECPRHAVPAPEPPLDGEGTTPCTGLAPPRAALRLPRIAPTARHSCAKKSTAPVELCANISFRNRRLTTQK